jgi:hypothetical protein
LTLPRKSSLAPLFQRGVLFLSSRKRPLLKISAMTSPWGYTICSSRPRAFPPKSEPQFMTPRRRPWKTQSSGSPWRPGVSELGKDHRDLHPDRSYFLLSLRLPSGHATSPGGFFSLNMDAFQALAYGFGVALHGNNLLACFAGVLVGTVVRIFASILRLPQSLLMGFFSSPLPGRDLHCQQQFSRSLYSRRHGADRVYFEKAEVRYGSSDPGLSFGAHNGKVATAIPLYGPGRYGGDNRPSHPYRSFFRRPGDRCFTPSVPGGGEIFAISSVVSCPPPYFR